MHADYLWRYDLKHVNDKPYFATNLTRSFRQTWLYTLNKVINWAGDPVRSCYMNRSYLTPHNYGTKNNLKTIKEMFTNDKNVCSTTCPSLTWADCSNNGSHCKKSRYANYPVHDNLVLFHWHQINVLYGYFLISITVYYTFKLDQRLVYQSRFHFMRTSVLRVVVDKDFTGITQCRTTRNHYLESSRAPGVSCCFEAILVTFHEKL